MKKTLSSLAISAIALSALAPNASANISAANTLAAKGVITASSDFRLNDTITRKEMMKIVMNLSGKNVPDTCKGSFWDVTNDWGCKYIEAALVNGFIAKNASFRPDDTITKAESIKLALGARGISKATDTGDWQADWMNTAFDNSLLSAKYSDHNTKALRGWIFGLGASPIAARSTQTASPEPTPVVDSVAPIVVQEEKKVEVVALSWVYSDYSPELVGKNANTVLFFHASWCPSCKAAEKNILADDISKTDLSILKVDYDSSVELRKKFGVTTQHTFVQVDANSELVKKWNGSNSIDSIVSKLK